MSGTGKKCGYCGEEFDWDTRLEDHEKHDCKERPIPEGECGDVLIHYLGCSFCKHDTTHRHVFFCAKNKGHEGPHRRVLDNGVIVQWDKKTNTIMSTGTP